MLHILTVDDSKMARKRLLSTLDSFNIQHKTYEEDDGVKALKLLEDSPINLLITDLEMPNMDGVQLINEVRKTNLSLNIIVVTTVANAQIKQLLKSDRFTYFMKKPIDTKVLETYLKKVQHQIKLKDI